MPPILVPSSVKRFAAQILVIAKLNERLLKLNDFILRDFSVISFVPPRNYLFKISNLIIRIMWIKNVNINNIQY